MSNSTRNAVPFWLKTAAALMASSCLTPISAFAACSPSPAQSGDTVVCTGTDTLGVGTNSQEGVTVTINSGAVVGNSEASSTIRLTTGATVTNNGQINGKGGVFLGGFSSLFTNSASGIVDVTELGAYATQDSMILNKGTIKSEKYGVQVDYGGTLINQGLIEIDGGFVGRGVDASLNAVVSNSGTITVQSDEFGSIEGLFLNGADSLTNDGLVSVNSSASSGDAYGIRGSAKAIINNDVIEVTAKDSAIGMWLDGPDGFVDNSGTLNVSSDQDAVGIKSSYGLQLDNSGSISVIGVTSAIAVQIGAHSSFVNTGSVTAVSGGGSTGVTMGGTADDTVSIVNKGSIDADVAITVYQTAGPSTPPSADIDNSGTIKGDIVLFEQNDQLVNKALGSIVGDVDMGGGSDTLINLGYMKGSVKLGDGDDFYFVATGDSASPVTVDGGAGFDSIGIYSNAKESGSLEGQDGFEGVAVFADENAQFTIADLTAGSDFSLGLMGSGIVINETSLVSGVIGYPVVRMVGDGLQFRNEGTIAGGTGVSIEGPNQSFINGSKASINADGDGIVANDNQSVTTLAGSTLTASNVGIRAGDGNQIVNGGSIVVASGTGMDLGDANDAVNTGTITASIGIKAGNPDVFGGIEVNVIENAGTIDASSTGIVVNRSDVKNSGSLTAGSIGISSGDNNMIDNSGKISVGTGGQAIVTQGSVTNSGTITSKGDGIVTSNTVSNTGDITATGNAIEEVGKFGMNVYNNGTLIGANAFVGGTGSDNINNSGIIRGNMALGDGGDTILLIAGSDIDGDIDGGGGTDAITNSGDGVFSGKLTGIEILNITGGVLEANLDAGSTVNNTLVRAGAGIRLNGSLTGNVAIEQDGVFEGNGTITGNVTNAGIVAPGNSIGTLSVTGNYTQTATGQFLVELGPSSADKLAVSGTATLDGILSTGLVATDYAALEGKSYTVLTAGSISGALDNLGTVQQGFWTLNIAQAGGAVNVTVTDVNVPIGATQPLTSPLSGMLRYIVNGGASGGSGGIEIGGDNNNLPIGGVIEGTGEGVPPDAGRMSAQGDDAGDQQVASLDYDDMGDWESQAAAFTGNWSTLGDRTPAMAMPKTGTAEFAGTTKGELTETASGTPEAFVVEGNVLLTANFASGLVNADFTDMEKIDAHGVAAAWVDFRARMSIADGTSEFAGTAGTDDGVWSGKAKGGFYGDDNGMPGHAAGLWSMSSPLGRALGGFMAKRQ